MLDNLLNPLPELPLYNPTKRVTQPHSVLFPISKLEVAQSKTSSNPLRTRPRATTHDYVPEQSTSAATSSSLPARPSASTSQRKRPLVQDDDSPNEAKRWRDDKRLVAEYYNARPNIDRLARGTSPIIGLKNFNNWVKSVLIAKFGRRESDVETPYLKVLDLGCGKGGDLQKWLKAGTAEYIGIDLAAVSVEQARSRWKGLRPPKFDADFFDLDCYEESISKVLLPAHTERLFDIVSMQFCLHYAFETEEKARMMFENVTRFLKPGGVLIGTIPDQDILLTRLEAIERGQPLEFGNEVYKVKFDDADCTPRFGHRYTFFLEDAVEEVPEYVVYWSQLTRLAQEYGLELHYKADFQTIFVEERKDPDFAKLLYRMKVVDADGETEMTLDQWEAATLYVGFVLVKVDKVET